MRQIVGILGTPVDVLDTQAVLARLEQFIQEGRFHQVATANTDFLINALEDPELRHILRHADLVMPDGMPLVWASRLMRAPLPERVTGADIVPALAELSARKGYRIFMLGARPDVAQRAKERMEADYPGLQIVGCVSPPVAPLLDMNHQEILENIHRARPDILLVAFGNPKQEKWIHLHREELSDVPVCIGVGGTFDFIAGNTARAPLWMQRSGLEWIHRLGQEPKRLWKRYVRDLGQFSRCLFKQWAAVGYRARKETAEIHAAQIGDFTILSLVGDLNSSAIPPFRQAAEQAFNAGTHLILDLQQVTYLDGEALGTLLNLPKRAAQSHLEMRMAAVPPAISRILKGSQLHDGPFLSAPSLAHAFLNGHYAELCWNVQSGRDAALVEVSGVSDPFSLKRLETFCHHLLDTGKRLDMDLRDVTYVDSALLMTLHRLTRNRNRSSKLRLVPGRALKAMLVHQKAADRFTLLETPELPPDAVLQMLDARERLPFESSLEEETALNPANTP
jgi:N-acetylglucosaminyldiphosphoundecaprenol N-acetyl-beta-D-mannosaminyltransferase